MELFISEKETRSIKLKIQFACTMRKSKESDHTYRSVVDVSWTGGKSKGLMHQRSNGAEQKLLDASLDCRELGVRWAYV